MKKNQLKYMLLAAVVLTPVLSFAALGGLKSLLGDIRGLIYDTRYIVVSLAFLYFFWGTGQFILNAGDPKQREDGKQKMIWGVIALFVIISIMGILGFIGRTIDIPINPTYQGDALPPGFPTA